METIVTYLIQPIDVIASDSTSTQFQLDAHLMLQLLPDASPESSSTSEQLVTFIERVEEIRAELNQTPINGEPSPPEPTAEQLDLISEELLSDLEEIIVDIAIPDDWQIVWSGIEG